MATKNLDTDFLVYSNFTRSLVDKLCARKGVHRVGLVAYTISLQGFFYFQ